MDRRFKMIKKILLFTIPVVLFFICLFFSLSAYLRYREAYIEVPVASHQLYQRSLLGEEDLVMMEVPKAYLNGDVYLEKEDIIGKYVKLSYSLPKGSLIYKGALEEDIRDLAVSYLKENEASYDLYTSEVKMNAGSLGVGMYVDVYLSIKKNDYSLSDLLFEGCRIIGLYDNQGKPIKAYETDARIAIVSIALNREDVNYLNKALMLGSVSVLCSSRSYDIFQKAVLNKDSEVFPYLQ